MPKDYIPAPDPEFSEFVDNIIAVLTPILATLGLVPADLTPTSSNNTIFKTDLQDFKNKETAYRASSEKKKDSRGLTEKNVRALVKRIQPHPAMTDALRAQLKITIPDLIKTPKVVGPEIPAMYLESGTGRVIVHWGTSPQNEQLNSKPAWASGAIIRRRKASETEPTVLGYDTHSPYSNNITGPAADYFYSVAYRGTGEDDIGTFCPEQKMAAGG